MSDSQNQSELQDIQISAPIRGALVHRNIGRIELTLLSIAILAFIGAQIPFVN